MTGVSDGAPNKYCKCTKCVLYDACIIFVEGDPNKSGRYGGHGKSLLGGHHSHQKASSQVLNITKHSRDHLDLESLCHRLLFVILS